MINDLDVINIIIIILILASNTLLIVDRRYKVTYLSIFHLSERRPGNYPTTFNISKGWKDTNSYVDGAVIPEHQKYEHHVFQSSHLTAALFNHDASLLCRIPSFDNDKKTGNTFANIIFAIKTIPTNP